MIDDENKPPVWTEQPREYHNRPLFAALLVLAFVTIHLILWFW